MNKNFSYTKKGPGRRHNNYNARKTYLMWRTWYTWRITGGLVTGVGMPVEAEASIRESIGYTTQTFEKRAHKGELNYGRA